MPQSNEAPASAQSRPERTTAIRQNLDEAKRLSLSWALNGTGDDAQQGRSIVEATRRALRNSGGPAGAERARARTRSRASMERREPTLPDPAGAAQPKDGAARRHQPPAVITPEARALVRRAVVSATRRNLARGGTAHQSPEAIRLDDGERMRTAVTMWRGRRFADFALSDPPAAAAARKRLLDWHLIVQCKLTIVRAKMARRGETALGEFDDERIDAIGAALTDEDRRKFLSYCSGLVDKSIRERVALERIFAARRTHAPTPAETAPSPMALPRIDARAAARAPGAIEPVVVNRFGLPAAHHSWSPPVEMKPRSRPHLRPSRLMNLLRRLSNEHGKTIDATVEIDPRSSDAS